MAKGSAKGYLGIEGIVAIILAIIPITQFFLGLIQRIVDGNIVAFIVRLLVSLTGIGALIIWIMDIVKMVTAGTIWRVL